MAKDYIGCFYFDRNDIVPASDITEVEVSKGRFVNVGKTFVSLVDIDLLAYRRAHNSKTVRRNVSLPSWLNQAAEETGVNVSKVLQEALIDKMQIEQNF